MSDRKFRKLEELSLIDDFAFKELTSQQDENKSKLFCRILIETLLNRKVRVVKCMPQNKLQGINTKLHGICMDVEIEAVTMEDGCEIADVGVRPDIYDIEPNIHPQDEPRRMRFYTALIDSRSLQSGVHYENMKDIFTVMITPYDPFGMDSMVYTVRPHIEEFPDLKYEDGITMIFLYTRGTKNIPSQSVQSMLQFIEESTAENAKASEECQILYDMLEEIKQSREVGVNYMKWVETVYYERKEEHEQTQKQTREEVLTIISAYIDGASADWIAESYGYDLGNVQEVINDYECKRSRQKKDISCITGTNRVS